MYKVRVDAFSLDVGCRRCNDCCRLNQCILAQEDGDPQEDFHGCPECGRPYEEMTPWWHAHLRMCVTREYGDDMQPGEISGPMMDTVMGMTINDYWKLKETYSDTDMDSYVCKYFTKSVFLMRNNGSRVNSFSLIPGCQLTFKVWLGLQPGFDYNEIADIIEDEILDEDLYIDETLDGDFPDGLTKDEISELL